MTDSITADGASALERLFIPPSEDPVYHRKPLYRIDSKGVMTPLQIPPDFDELVTELRELIRVLKEPIKFVPHTTTIWSPVIGAQPNA